MTSNPPSNDPVCPGTNVTFSAAASGTTTVQWQISIEEDEIAPVPDEEELSAITGECSVTISSAPTATDECAGEITGTTIDPLVYSAQGTYTVHWVYDDGNGNTSTQEQTVIVDDVTDPTISVTLSPTSLWPPSGNMHALYHHSHFIYGHSLPYFTTRDRGHRPCYNPEYRTE